MPPALPSEKRTIRSEAGTILIMRKVLTFTALVVILMFVGLYYVSGSSPLPAGVIPSHSADLKNGEALFHAGGCASCHAAPAGKKCDDPRSKDKTVLSGGRCLKTKYGIFYVPNISSDALNGIGSLTDIEFANAMLRGISRRGRHYYPSFPYTSYSNMTLEDVLDLKAYLGTLPPSKRRGQAHELAFPYSLRQIVGFWKFLNFERQKPNYRQYLGSSQLDRGRYLVEGPGHCGECHTPRDAMGALRPELALSGAPAATGKGWVPNITPHKSGLKTWSENQISDLLATGLTPDFDSIGGDMVAVQENMKEIGASDRAAIAHYLKSLNPVEGLSPPPKKKK